MVALNLLYVLFLSETWCMVEEITKVRNQLGWRNDFFVSCKFVTKKGGKGVSRSVEIALLWKKGTTVVVRSFFDHHIDVLFKGSEGLPS